MCEGASLVDTIRQDIDRYLVGVERDGEPRAVALPRLALSPRIWATVNHRISHYTLTRIQRRLLRRVVAVMGFVVQRFIRNVSGIQIDPRAHLGPGVFFPHEGYIVIGPVRVGRQCTISQGVTLGRGERGSEPGYLDTPVLGDRVWVGPGAVIAGRVTVGSDAAVGANSVALRDVPACGVVLGVPARLVSHQGSFAQVHYRDMDLDEERAEALRAAEAAAGRRE